LSPSDTGLGPQIRTLLLPLLVPMLVVARVGREGNLGPRQAKPNHTSSTTVPRLSHPSNCKRKAAAVRKR